MRVLALSLALVAGPALAQQAPAPVAPPPAQTPTPAPDPGPAPEALDPLADLISQSGQALDEEAAETAAKPAPRHKATILPIPGAEPATTPDGAPSKALVYDMRVKGSVAAAQSLQGPLDGGWRVIAEDGSQLYALQIVDKPGGSGVLEGAWRDVRRTGAVGSTGLIDELRHDEAEQQIFARFTARDGRTTTLNLRPYGEDRWVGEMIENGGSQTVLAEHLLPEAPPGYETQARGPYVWPPRASPSRNAGSAAAAACSTKGKKGKALKAAKAKCAAAAKKAKAASLKKGKSVKAKATAAKRSKATVKKKKR